MMPAVANFSICSPKMQRQVSKKAERKHRCKIKVAKQVPASKHLSKFRAACIVLTGLDGAVEVWKLPPKMAWVTHGWGYKAERGTKQKLPRLGQPLQAATFRYPTAARLNTDDINLEGQTTPPSLSSSGAGLKLATSTFFCDYKIDFFFKEHHDRIQRCSHYWRYAITSRHNNNR